MPGNLVSALTDLKEKEVLEIVQHRLNIGDNPISILDDARCAMETIGNRFASGEYFIPDLVYSGEILKEISDIVKPKLTGEAEIKRLGKIVFGTVAGDIHDIGKSMVSFFLDISGFKVK